MEFVNIIKHCFQNAINFKDRAGRPEYWYFVLFCFLLGLILGAVFGDGSMITTLVQLALFVPSIAVAARRLHDTGRSGWWQLISLTIIGLIPLIYWLAKPGDAGENRFGKTAASIE